MAGEDKNELIDFDTTYSERIPGGICMKPLLPAPLSSFGVCDYGANPFDQLLDLTNKNFSSKDDPFEMVFEKATGNIHTETKNMLDICSNTTPSKSEKTNVISYQPEFTSLQFAKNYLNVSDDIHMSDRSGGLIAGTREEKVVNTAKLLDLPSPVFARTVNESVQCQEENKISFTDLKHNTYNEHEESTSPNSPKTNKVLVHSESSDSTPGRKRRYSTSDIKVKAVIAERVKKCIQKALNDSREVLRSGSVTDLTCSEPEQELVRHRRSYSLSSVQKLIAQSPDNGTVQTSMFEVESNSPWRKSGTSYGDILNTGFQNTRKSSSSRISRSFDDLRADLDILDAKVSWKVPDEWKFKKFLIDKCETTAATCAVHPGRLGHSFGEDAVEMKTEADNKSVFLDARSLSYVCEKAAEGNSSTDASINDIKPPWMEEHNNGDVTFDEHDKAEWEQKECSDAVGCLRLKSNDSKVFSDSNISLDSSGGLNPITHSTPVLRKDLLRATALCSEPKISPLLPVGSVTVTQKLRPLRAVSQQEQKKGPLKAVVPVGSMTRNTKNTEAVADQRAGKISQNVATHKAESVTTVSSDGKKPMTTGNIKSSLSSQKKVNKSSASVNVKEVKKIQPIHRMISVYGNRSPSSSKSVKHSTPSSDKSPKCLPRVDSGGHERSRSFEVKELPKQSPRRRPLQKSRSSTSVPLVQSTTARVLTEKNPVDSANDKKSSPANIRKTASSMTPKAQTPVRKLIIKPGRHVLRGKENQTP